MADDSHKRWDTMNLKRQEIWNRYDTQVSTNILNTALKNPARTLFEVYHALSIARRHCEIEKAPNDSSSGRNFGHFQLGGSREPNIYPSLLKELEI